MHKSVAMLLLLTSGIAAGLTVEFPLIPATRPADTQASLRASTEPLALPPAQTPRKPLDVPASQPRPTAFAASRPASNQLTADFGAARPLPSAPSLPPGAKAWAPSAPIDFLYRLHAPSRPDPAKPLVFTDNTGTFTADAILAPLAPVLSTQLPPLRLDLPRLETPGAIIVAEPVPEPPLESPQAIMTIERPRLP